MKIGKPPLGTGAHFHAGNIYKHASGILVLCIGDKDISPSGLVNLSTGRKLPLPDLISYHLYLDVTNRYYLEEVTNEA